MTTWATTTTLLVLLLAMATTTTISGLQDRGALQMAQTQVLQAKNWIENSLSFHGPGGNVAVALRDCAKLYGESEFRLARMVFMNDTYTRDDELTWVSSVMANHRTCLDGLKENGYDKGLALGTNLTTFLSNVLTLCGKDRKEKGKEKGKKQLHGDDSMREKGLLASWNPSNSKADFTVAQDGSGTHRTISEAVDALASMGHDRPVRVVFYVKSGVYSERVEISRKMYNVMFVGDGIDKTVVTGDRDISGAGSLLNSATFDVYGDGFWARDMTFENTAGPQKHQAVALKVSSDKSIFYKCSFKAYQDTLYVHSNRQLYSACQIYGTVDFIFGDASASFQDSDIFVRKPMENQFTSITAHGREKPDEPTGIVIHGCRVRPASDLADAKGSFKTYLGRPWKEYSRTVFMKTDIDGFVDPKGWKEWEGSYALSTLYYGEFKNTGSGGSTENRVNWPGFHVLSEEEASAFTVSRFMDGESWIPASGVPFWVGI